MEFRHGCAIFAVIFGAIIGAVPGYFLGNAIIGAVICAVVFGIISFVLARNADIEAQSKEDEYLSFLATVRFEDVDQVQRKLNFEPEYLFYGSISGTYGYESPLHVAMQGNKIKAIEILFNTLIGLPENKVKTNLGKTTEQVLRMYLENIMYPPRSRKTLGELMLKNRDFSVKQTAAEILKNQEWSPSNTELSILFNILTNEFSKVVKEGKAAIPYLVDTLRHGKQQLRENSMAALVEIGQPSVERLVEALNDSNFAFSEVAMTALKALNWQPSNEHEKEIYTIYKTRESEKGQKIEARQKTESQLFELLQFDSRFSIHNEIQVWGFGYWISSFDKFDNLASSIAITIASGGFVKNPNAYPGGIIAIVNGKLLCIKLGHFSNYGFDFLSDGMDSNTLIEADCSTLEAKYEDKRLSSELILKGGLDLKIVFLDDTTISNLKSENKTINSLLRIIQNNSRKAEEFANFISS